MGMSSCIVEMQDGPRFEIRANKGSANNDYGVAYEVFVDSLYDLEGLKGRKIDVIVDMGVNVGYATLKFLTKFPGSRVIGFEPHPEHAAQARRNLKIAGESHRVVLHESAAGAHSRRLRLHDNMSGSHLTNEVNDRTFEVEVIDALELLSNQKIDVLKIDIEGGEYEILDDPRFAALRIPAIVMEWHRRGKVEEDHAWVSGKLRSAGYSVREIFNKPWGGMLWAFLES